jgi:hypothetical protein
VAISKQLVNQPINAQVVGVVVMLMLMMAVLVVECYCSCGMVVKSHTEAKWPRVVSATCTAANAITDGE